MLYYMVENAKAHLASLKLSMSIARKYLEEKRRDESMEIALAELQALSDGNPSAKIALERINAIAAKNK